MNDGQLRRLLTDRSAWWRNPEWERDDADLRDAAIAPYVYEPRPLEGLDAPGLYVLRGPRRVGKSVELKRAIAATIAAGANPRLVFFCSCDGLNAQDVRRLVAVGHKDTATLSGERYWFLDEITAVSGWATAIKELRDSDPVFRRSCVVLSGSSARDLREATKALAGRRGDVADSDRLLLPMDFRAFCQATGDFGRLPDTTLRPWEVLAPTGAEAVTELVPFFSDLDHSWQSYLRVGGFPRAVSDFVERADVGDGFVRALWDVIAGDAFQSTGMTEAEVATFLERLLVGIGSPLNASALAREVGLADNHRVNDRVDALGFALLAWRSNQARDGLPNLRAQEKVYFIDPLIARLPHLRDARRRDPDDSQMTEQQLGLLLLRSAGRAEPDALLEGGTVMYERTASNAEIDFVGPDLEAAFEAKYVDGPWRRAAQTMRSRYRRGAMVTRTVLDLDEAGEGSRVWAIPAGIVGWLLAEQGPMS